MIWSVMTLSFGVIVNANVLCNHEATTQPITAILTCDGDMTVYADGVEINRKTSSYKVPQTSTLPSGSSLLAVHSHNPNRTARILGSIHVSMTTASEGWVCTDRYYPAWNTKQFVDTSWAPAKTHGRNEFSSFPFDMVENITSTAEWIGTENDTNSLYCRFPLCPQRECLTIRTTRIENHKLEGSVFATFHVPHIGKCALKCYKAHARCQSFNYISNTNTCELNESKAQQGSKNLVTRSDVMYFYRID